MPMVIYHSAEPGFTLRQCYFKFLSIQGVATLKNAKELAECNGNQAFQESRSGQERQMLLSVERREVILYRSK